MPQYTPTQHNNKKKRHILKLVRQLKSWYRDQTSGEESKEKKQVNQSR
jgi:hypothetical protein